MSSYQKEDGKNIPRLSPPYNEIACCHPGIRCDAVVSSLRERPGRSFDETGRDSACAAGPPFENPL